MVLIPVVRQPEDLDPRTWPLNMYRGRGFLGGDSKVEKITTPLRLCLPVYLPSFVLPPTYTRPSPYTLGEQ